MQYVDREKIKNLYSIGMEFLLNENEYAGYDEMEEYKLNASEQEETKSLRSLPGIFEFLEDCLKTEFDSLPAFLWNHEIHKNSSGISKTFAKVISFTLTDYVSNYKQPVTNIKNHERTAFVKYVVPMFKYLSQETNLIECSWCEKLVEAQKLAGLEGHDYILNSDDKKYADGLGKNILTKDEELFMEASSGFEREEISHTLDDT